MARGYGGTMQTTFFPQTILDKLFKLGFRKSKKGKLYKIYNDSAEQIQAFANCVTRGELKGVRWFVQTLEVPKRKLHFQEAIRLSSEFNEDYEEIKEIIIEYNS